MENKITDITIRQFGEWLAEDEKSEATIKKYMRDVKTFQEYIGDGGITKETTKQYKEYLKENYKPSSVNSMLASVNRFFKEEGWFDCMVRSIKIQREAFRSREREISKKEYYRLLEAARQNGNMRLYHLMETICATGIRVSELCFITVEAVKVGRAIVSLKGKTRTVLIPRDLCKKLRKYAGSRKIASGSLFISKSGNPLDRSNILHEMKALCKKAGVDSRKVFPHNLRHLFACLFYQKTKDISRLADLLGHSNMNTTRIYTCVSSEQHVRQIEQLGLIL